MRHFWMIVAAMLLLMGGAGRGAGFAVSLDLSSGKETGSAKSKPAGTDPLAHRATFQAAASSAFVLKWKVTRTADNQANDALVHFYVVKVARQGQAPPPLDPSRVVIEGAITMDFPKGDTASGSQPFHLDEPGIYLVRVETGGDPDKPDSADAAELELVAK